MLPVEPHSVLAGSYAAADRMAIATLVVREEAKSKVTQKKGND